MMAKDWNLEIFTSYEFSIIQNNANKFYKIQLYKIVIYMHIN